MKTCSNCKTLKSDTRFAWRNKARGIKQSWCRGCQQNYDKSYWRRNKIRQRKLRDDRRSKLREANTRNIITYLYRHPCVDCKESDPIVLDFDHIRGSKQYNVSNMVSMGLGWETILKEIGKCEVRCANCHRRKTARIHHSTKMRILKK